MTKDLEAVMKAFRWFSFGIAFGLIIAVAFGFERTGVNLSPKERAQEPSNYDDLPPKQRLFVNARAASEDQEDGKLRIVCFGAHPDDCEIRAGGVGAMWAELGHHVKFVSATNGDIGHWRIAGGPLAIRRFDEVQKAARVLGVKTDVLDIHDGELMPTLENRRTFTRKIREWNADIVMSHRPNDYHPNHRYTGVLTQDSAFMVAVPFFCPNTPHLTKNPVFLFYSDNFERPNPFQPDVVVSIDSVIEKKIDALVLMESQFLEGGALGYTREFPETEEAREAGRKRARANFERRFARTADTYRQKLIELYGEKVGKDVKYAEAFEVCEYGRQPKKEELLQLFPILSQKET